MNAHNPVNLAYGGETAMLMKGEGGGEIAGGLFPTAPAHFVWDAETYR